MLIFSSTKAHPQLVPPAGYATYHRDLPEIKSMLYFAKQGNDTSVIKPVENYDRVQDSVLSGNIELIFYPK